MRCGRKLRKVSGCLPHRRSWSEAVYVPSLDLMVIMSQIHFVVRWHSGHRVLSVATWKLFAIFRLLIWIWWYQARHVPFSNV